VTTEPFGPLVTGDWLAAHLAEVRVVDVRWYLDGRSGLAAYEQGHLPSAVWLDLDGDLSAPADESTGRHPLPSPEHFAAALGRVGIAEGQPVVAYDDAGGSIAARLWWMLHVLGEPVDVLDGGMANWPGEFVAEVPRLDPVDRPARPWPPSRFVDADELVGADAVVLDARNPERYVGRGPTDPRPGHIPGARNVPWPGNLGEDERFLPATVLGERYEDVAGRRVIAYCGSGVTACHDLLALALLGRDDVALYPGSWSQWGADPSRPAEAG
jgi:thiosulfate/3-mercaptopyruvate sulfurtransferase